MTSPLPTFTVTGATGAIGSRVAARLSADGLRPRLVVRDADRAPALPGAHVEVVPGYHDGDAVRAALAGTRTLLLVSAEEQQDRLAHHRTVVAAAAAAGVERIVYTSFLGAAADATFTLARDHHHTEQAVVAAGIALTALRDSLYLDVLPGFVVDGALRGPAGDGRFAPVARADVAEVAVAAMLDDRLAGAALDVTGGQRLTLGEVAAELSRLTGERITYVDEPVAEAIAAREASGAAAWQVRAWVSTYTAIAAGELDVVSDTVRRLTGHPPRALADVLAGDG
jgi:NAD(P)H dehydrogenase (quinone)